MSIELITWHKPVEGKLPDADITVLARTDDESEPVWPAYYDGAIWRGPDNMPLGRVVIEWCDMPGGTADQHRVRHVAKGREYGVVSRGIRIKPDGAAEWQPAVLYANGKGDLFARSIGDFDSEAFEPIDKP